MYLFDLFERKILQRNSDVSFELELRTAEINRVQDAAFSTEKK